MKDEAWAEDYTQYRAWRAGYKPPLCVECGNAPSDPMHCPQCGRDTCLNCVHMFDYMETYHCPICGLHFAVLDGPNENAEAIAEAASSSEAVV